MLDEPDDEITEFSNTPDHFRCPFYLTLALGEALLVQIKVVDIRYDTVSVAHVGGFIPPFAQPTLLFRRATF